VHNTDELKQRFLHVWHGTDQTIIDNAIDEWCGQCCSSSLQSWTSNLFLSSVTIILCIVLFIHYLSIKMQ